MIYKREEFIEESPEDEKFPAKQIETLTTLDGAKTRYIGRLSMGIQTPMGVSSIPITFEIEASGIEEAFRQFEAKAEVEIEKAKGELQDQLQDMRRKAQSRIVTPGEIAAGGSGIMKM